MSICGCTGGLVGQEACKGDNTDALVSTIGKHFSSEATTQGIHAAVDNASGKMYKGLKKECRNFKHLSLDGMHLPIANESARWEKKTKGSLYLRRIMRKFTASRGSVPSARPFTGEEVIVPTAAETEAMHRLKNLSMGQVRAQRIHDDLDGSRRVKDRAEFVLCLASLAKFFGHELTKLATSGRTLDDILVSAAAPERIEWLLNGTRYFATLTPAQRELNPDGTCSNEAFHREEKDWFMGQRMNKLLLQFKLALLQLAKLVTHNAAIYCNTVRMSQCITDPTVGDFFESTWSHFCGLMVPESCK